MPHSFNKIWIHAIWATKDRLPLIHSSIEAHVYDYMSKQLIELGCPVHIINGMADHVHALFLLNPQKSIAEVVKQVKGSTSHWLNHDYANSLNPNFARNFAWQTGYGAFSVSESQLSKVFQYINSQKQHHQKISFEQEFETFLKRYKIENE